MSAARVPKGGYCMQFTVGQHIVHPKYGLGIVNRIENTELLGHRSRCLTIRFPRHKTQIVVPIEKAADLNMRAPMAPAEVAQVLKALKRRARALSKLRPRERVKIFKPIVAHGSPTDLAAVIRDLGRLGKVKKLTDEETEMFEAAIKALAREMALAQDKDPLVLRAEIEKILER
jgi:CarD family transcriptional regulator